MLGGPSPRGHPPPEVVHNHLARPLTDLSFSLSSWRGFHVRAIGPRVRLLPKLFVWHAHKLQLGIGTLFGKPAPQLDPGQCACCGVLV